VVVVLLPLSLPNTRVKRSTTQVAAAVAECYGSGGGAFNGGGSV